MGYKEDDYELLCRDLTENYDYRKIVDIVNLEDSGVRFSVFMNLGVEKKKRFRTVWQKDNPNSAPRFITAHRED